MGGVTMDFKFSLVATVFTNGFDWRPNFLFAQRLMICEDTDNSKTNALRFLLGRWQNCIGAHTEASKL